MHGSEAEGRTNMGGGVRGLGERCPAEPLSDDGSQKNVVLPCLAGETEETEEDKCAKDGNPPIDFKGINAEREMGPGILEDTGIPPVSVIPGNPRANIQQGIRDDTPNGQGNGEAEIHR